MRIHRGQYWCHVFSPTSKLTDRQNVDIIIVDTKITESQNVDIIIVDTKITTVKMSTS
jgi:hypothetical protein